MKKLRMKEGLSVPMLITKTLVDHEPTSEVRSKFVGMRQGLWNLGVNVFSVAKVLLKESFFEEEIERDDGGVLEKQHFAVNLAHDDKGPFLDVMEIGHEVPCGVSFEFIQLAGTRPPTVGRRPHSEAPNPYETQARAIKARKEAQERMRAGALQEATEARAYEEPPEVFTYEGRLPITKPSATDNGENPG